MADLSPLDRLVIESECTRLVYRYAGLNDAGDYVGVADLFTADGSFARPTAPETPLVGRDVIRAAFAARPKGRMSRHIVSNVIIEVESETLARGTSYILLFTAAAPESGTAKADPVQLVGGFSDTFAKEDGIWKFRQRQGSVSLSSGGS